MPALFGGGAVWFPRTGGDRPQSLDAIKQELRVPPHRRG